MRDLWTKHYAETPKYHIPEPLYLDREHCLLFMRYWPGESFLSLFYKSAFRGHLGSSPLVESYVRCIAEWLVDFQGLYSSVDEREVPTEMLNFDAQLNQMSFLDPTDRRRISQKLSGMKSAMPRLRDSYVHDQYLFRNILYNNGAVCVVDFPHFKTGWPLYDFFTFYTGLERLKQYPFVSSAAAERMKDLFMQTYCSAKGIRYDRQELENLWVFFVVAYVGQRYRYKKFGGLRGTVNNRFVRKMFDKLSQWSRV